MPPAPAATAVEAVLPPLMPVLAACCHGQHPHAAVQVVHTAAALLIPALRCCEMRCAKSARDRMVRRGTCIQQSMQRQSMQRQCEINCVEVRRSTLHIFS